MTWKKGAPIIGLAAGLICMAGPATYADWIQTTRTTRHVVSSDNLFTAEGRITDLDRGDNEFSLDRSGDDSDMHFTYDSGTRILRGRQTMSDNALHEGRMVKVYYSKDEDGNRIAEDIVMNPTHSEVIRRSAYRTVGYTNDRDTLMDVDAPVVGDVIDTPLIDIH
ncbi:MAG: hypothetical protein JO317_05130 [Verrucomicrobiae bacterium]|nr:hypothetical protein [Verrucomicrobiae bacterium]